jgi:putative endonuclease
MRRFFVYVLASYTRVLYVGVTNDLARRLEEHRAGACTFTARYRIHRLVYAEETADVRAAIRREKQIKGWTRDRKLALVDAANPEWRDLG